MGRGIIESGLFRSEMYRVEQRTTDPADHQEGERWIRTDLAPETDQIATYRFDMGADGVVDIPIYDASASVDGVEKVRRVQVGGQTGFIPFTSSRPTYPEWAMQHNGTRLGAHDALEASAIPDSGVARWEFEQDVSDSWNGYDGTDNTSVGYTTNAEVGSYAKSFDGDDYVTVPELTVFSGSFSLAGWMYFDDVSSDRALATGDVNEGGGSMPWGLWWDSSENGWRLYDGTNSVYSSSTPSTGVWYHLCWTHDGSTSTIYVDGTDEGSGSLSPSASGTTDIIGAGDTSAKLINGALDDIRLYSNPLTSTEVSNLYQTGSIHG